jgi:hypothetical protein
MPFQEKSAYIMSFALLLGSIFYFGIVTLMSKELDHWAPPVLPLIVVFTIILVSIAIIGHVLIAVLAPKDANAKMDERERKIFDRAGHISGYFFGTGVVLSLGLYLFFYDGNLLFYTVFGSLIISHFSEYITQIVLYRTVV